MNFNQHLLRANSAKTHQLFSSRRFDLTKEGGGQITESEIRNVFSTTTAIQSLCGEYASNLIVELIGVLKQSSQYSRFLNRDAKLLAQEAKKQDNIIQSSIGTDEQRELMDDAADNLGEILEQDFTKLKFAIANYYGKKKVEEMNIHAALDATIIMVELLAIVAEGARKCFQKQIGAYYRLTFSVNGIVKKLNDLSKDFRGSDPQGVVNDIDVDRGIKAIEKKLERPYELTKQCYRKSVL